MRRSSRLTTPLVFVAFLLAAGPALGSAKSEDEWIAQLGSPDEGKVTSALQGLEKNYPESPKARAKIIEKLTDSREKVRRKAARVLGAIHAQVDRKTLDQMAALLDSKEKDAVVDGLKALRGVNAGPAVPKILPLLKSPDENIKRDACRTLAEVADASAIPKIQPLLDDPNPKVRLDAHEAVARLKEKK
jgi:HEAT repeat protein